MDASLVPLTCVVCEEPFTRTAAQRGRRPKTCSPACRLVRRNTLRVAREKGQPPHGEPLPPESPLHGTPGGYGYHRCRCEQCRKANADRQNAWQNEKRSTITHDG